MEFPVTKAERDSFGNLSCKTYLPLSPPSDNKYLQIWTYKASGGGLVTTACGCTMHGCMVEITFGTKGDFSKRVIVTSARGTAAAIERQHLHALQQHGESLVQEAQEYYANRKAG